MTPTGATIAAGRRRPAFSARCAVVTATLALPRGALRSRYRQEFLAELHFIDTSSQLRFSGGILSRAWALRRALTEEGIMTHDTVHRAPLLCRPNLRHHWHTERTEDGSPYRRCRRCGKDNPSTGSASGTMIIPSG
jgi:hypothetical protein